MKSSDVDNKVSGTILIVDYIQDNLRLLFTTLTEQGYEVLCFKNGKRALRSLQQDVPDLILLDINMPDMSGYDICQSLRNNQETYETPVIFLSAKNEIEEKIKAFNAGGIDYISKPFEIQEVVARVRTHMSLVRANSKIKKLNAKLETWVQERTQELQVANEALQASNEALKQENKERWKAEDKLIYDAFHDSLTGLYNRALFLDRLDQILHHIKRHSNYHFAVLFIDLDRFKLINDSLGHGVGDQLLIGFAQLLTQYSRANDTVARLGGDEFVMILDDIHDTSDAIRVAERIQTQLKEFLPQIDLKFCTTASIGIVFGSRKYEKASEILRDADLAMYQAKALGKARYAIFNRELHQKALRRLEIESNLRGAIEKQELFLYYQPIFSLPNRKLIGFESLLRWQDAQQNIISAAEFIPIAEESGLIIPIGEWVLRQSCIQLKQWQQTIPEASELTINVNLSSIQFDHGDLIQLIDRILRETGLEARFLKLEITESILLENTNSVLQMLAEMSQRGIQICLDDFGTGYSCLSYLHRLPIDILKIDRSFVSSMETEGENYEIVRTIITLGQALGMQLVAEGIERQKQCQQLESLNCEFGQGYLFSKPLDVHSAQALISNHAHPLVAS